MGRMRAMVAVTLLLMAACGSDDDGPDANADPDGESSTTGPATTESSTTATATTTTATTSTTTTTVPAQPLGVLLVGDSLMIDTGPGALDALDGTAEPVEARVELFPSLPRTPEQTENWRSLVEDIDPDVVVVFIGTWEGGAAYAADEPPVGDPGFEAIYRSTVLSPWFDHLAEIGVHTIFLGSAPMPNDEAHARIQLTVDATEAEVIDRDEVDFVRAATVLGDDDLGFVEILPDPVTGVPERIRRVRDVHLCPDGVERVVDLILERLDLVADLTVGDEWRSGPWRTDVPYDPVVGCPPV